MPYTVHTLDGQAHTYPNGYPLPTITDGGDLLVHDHVDAESVLTPEWAYLPPVAAYPAGQWTHYHVEPSPYETDYSNTDEDEERQEVEGRLTVSVEERDKWQASFQRHLDAGRKAARAR